MKILVCGVEILLCYSSAGDIDLLSLHRFDVVHKMASGDTIRIPQANVAPNTGSGGISAIYREKMSRSVVYIDTHE